MTYCKECRKAKPPRPCAGCPYNRPPDLAPANEEALELWLECCTQWRTSGFGAVGLDYNAVHREARRLEIDLSPGLMAKIKHLERFELERQGKKDDRSIGPKH